MKILMCSARHFSVNYAINPWMKIGSVDSQKAVRQWQCLAQAYERLGVEVEVIQPDAALPDMVFSTDEGVVLDKKVVLGRFKYPERQPESIKYAAWFAEHGYEVMTTSQDHYLEGGECLQWQQQYFLGVGFRTEEATAAELSQLLGKPVTSLPLVDPFFYHLDTCFFPLDDRVAFYYPPAFSAVAKKRLQQTGAKLIAFSEAEAKNFAANSVVVNQTVLTQQGNPEFVKKLRSFGYEVVELEMSEFVKSGGGIHCLSLKV